MFGRTIENKIFIRRILIFGIFMTGLLIIKSCESPELAIRQSFPFELYVMPVPSEISEGETIEIRLEIQSEGNFEEAIYKIRYFQYEGEGMLQYFDFPPYQPNDLYVLPEQQFRLYYTAVSVENHSFSIWISDNFGEEQQLDFQFGN